MNRFSNLSQEDRRSVFEEYQARQGVQAVIAEKDFWVVWLLGLIFGTPELGGHSLFKGGTSLSKVFGAISRFSEDIDLGISPEILGWSEQKLEGASKNAWTEKIRPQLEADCARHVATRWLPLLEAKTTEILGTPTASKTWMRFELDQTSHSPVIYFDYPGAVKSVVSYIGSSVKVEFGSLADQRPTGSHSIEAMIANLLPGKWDDFRSSVVALEIERSFWEKATILHAEFHRPVDKRQPPRYARHYADFAALWRHPSAANARTRFDLLESVRVHKARFFASSWAHYGTAKPGTLRFVPPEHRIRELRADYEAMRSMFLDTPRPFDDLVATLKEAEQALNRP